MMFWHASFNARALRCFDKAALRPLYANARALLVGSAVHRGERATFIIYIHRHFVLRKGVIT